MRLGDNREERFEMVLVWTKEMGSNDWIAECVVNGHYESMGGKTSREAYNALGTHLKEIYNVSVGRA